MKNKIFIFLFVILTLITFSACSVETGSNTNNSNLYDVSGNNFKVYDYDFEKYTNINLQGNTSRRIRR